MHCGVRQGCPISPLLFAAAVDVLLRKLQRCIDHAEVRAFADDIGMVVEEWARDWGTAEGIFKEFATMSGLELNIPKTICIPLWEEGVQEIGEDDNLRASTWAEIGVRTHGTYLGFSSGPGKGSSSWKKPLAKFTKRVGMLPKGAGMHFSIVAYNSLCLATLLFIAQLEPPPPEADKAEEMGIRKCLGGPGNWFYNDDAFNLKEWYGQCRSIRSLRITAQAAQLRTLHAHNTTRKNNRIVGKSSISDMHRNLQALLRNPVDPIRAARWKEWYEGAHATVLECNNRNMAEMGLSLGDCLTAIAGGEPQPWPDKIVAKQKSTLQKFATKELLRRSPNNAEAHVRSHLDRWMDKEAGGPSDIWSHNFLIPGPPGRVARKVAANFLRMPALAPPRVCAAVWRCVFNAWCTHRRFQKRRSPENRCVFGCGPNAEDSIEHYCRCSVTRDAFKSKLRLDLHPKRALATFCISTNEQDRDDVLALSMLGIYAVYVARNHYSNVGGTNPIEASNYIKQNIIQGCFGHSYLTTLLQGRWHVSRMDN